MGFGYGVQYICQSYEPVSCGVICSDTYCLEEKTWDDIFALADVCYEYGKYNEPSNEPYGALSQVPSHSPSGESSAVPTPSPSRDPSKELTGLPSIEPSKKRSTLTPLLMCLLGVRNFVAIFKSIKLTVMQI